MLFSHVSNFFLPLIYSQKLNFCIYHLKAYPGMAPQGYTPQNWGMPAYQQQQWNAQTPATEAPPQNNQMQVNASAGQPDYSLQWAEYYRSMGMLREAEMIEQQVFIMISFNGCMSINCIFLGKVKRCNACRSSSVSTRFYSWYTCPSCNANSNGVEWGTT